MLEQLQRALEVIYGARAPHRVEDFVLGAEAAQRLGRRLRAPEELLVLEEGGELEVGLFVSPSVLQRLPSLGAGGARGFLDHLLPAFTTAAEGVSHFLYVVLRALEERTVSLLELEVQAEVDKFAISLLHLWKQGERHRSAELRSRLFERVTYRNDLQADERDRYRLANRLGAEYAARLEKRFVLLGHLEGLLRDLRLVYRMAGSAKLAYLGRGG